MQYINAYLYPNRIPVTLDLDATLTTRNKTVYARTVKLHRGIDNTLVFTVKNSDQKPVSLVDYTAELDIIDDIDQTQIVTISGTAVDAAKGIFQFVITELELLALDKNLYNYTIKVVDALGTSSPIYTDDYWNVRGQIEMQNGFSIKFQNSTILTFTDIADPVKYTSLKSGGYPSGYNLVHSFQIYFDNFSGTLTPQVTNVAISDITQSSWSDLTPIVYNDQTETTHIAFEGVYTAIRFKAVFDSGSITKILARS
jgi:hypothetical protein